MGLQSAAELGLFTFSVLEHTEDCSSTHLQKLKLGFGIFVFN